MLFGSMSEGLRSLRPYAWELGGGKLTEMPVTTFPLLKVPIHFSYILALATISPGLALGYFRAALGACRLRRIAPSLLLHPLDFLDGDEVGSLSFFPAMRMGHARKLALLDRAFDAFQDLFEVVGVGEHAAAVAAAARLRPTVPRFG
jgi:hypothetical protein